MSSSPNKRLAIAFFSDACGWDVIGQRPWFLESMHHRKRVTSVFGYSSACVPAIFTGRKPNENDHWSSFFYSPETSPFKALKALKALPSSVVDRGRVRGYVSAGVAAMYGFTGYFQIYNLPFDALEMFDYAEKRDILRPGGINRGTSIFDDLDRMGLPHFVSEWKKSEEHNFDVLARRLRKGEISFAYVHTGKIDALMHDESKESPRVDELLRNYQREIERMLSIAAEQYDEVRLCFFSDHGMCTVRNVVDLMPKVESTALTYGEDYVGIYDSTMMRFWFFRDGAEEKIRAALPDAEHGTWLTNDQLRSYGTYWQDGKFGHAIYALEPGYLLNPSHMGKVPLKGMHGYRTDHEDSFSALVANFEPATPIREITDYYHLMHEMVEWAAASRAA